MYPSTHKVITQGSRGLPAHAWRRQFLLKRQAVHRTATAVAASGRYEDAQAQERPLPRNVQPEQRRETSYTSADAYQRSEPAGPGPQSQYDSRGRLPSASQGSRDTQLQVVPVYESEVLLRYVRDVKGKEVITREEGTKMGRVGGVLVDSLGLTVQALLLKDALKGVQNACVPLIDLRQIGDVVLVEDEAAFQAVPRSQPFIAFLGMRVQDSRGVSIGKVSEIDFNPETGEIRNVYYDEYGLSLPLDSNLGMFNLYGLPVEAIVQVLPDAIMVNARYQWIESRGSLEAAGGVWKSLTRAVGGSDSNALALGQPRDNGSRQTLAEWEQITGMSAEEWYERYGNDFGSRQPAARARAPELPPPRENAYAARAQPRAQQSRGAPAGRRAGQPGRSRAAGATRQYREASRTDGGPGPYPERYTGEQRRGAGTGPSNGSSAMPSRPAFDQFVVKDNREKQYDVMQDPPRSRSAGDAINPRDRSMQ